MTNQAITAYTATFVDALTNSGISHVVISPGSRSTPLAYVFAEHPQVKVWINIDERSAAFFALGMAKALQKPVALLCTSGTAAANYFPAIVEAKLSRIPLIVLTADRPHELRDIGAPQAINQIDLYGKYPKWFCEMALPESLEPVLHYVRTTASRAVAIATNKPAGVVHLNFPFRDPLIPDFQEMKRYFTDQVTTQVYSGVQVLGSDEVERISSQINQYQKGIIVCGQLDYHEFAEKIHELAKLTAFPILSDPLANLRSHDTITSYDSFLRIPQVAEILRPELIIRLGAMPVSKALTIFIHHSQAQQIIVDSSINGWRDPTGTATEMIYCDEDQFCQQLLEKIEKKSNDSYLQLWQKNNQLTKKALNQVRNLNDDFPEGRLFAQLTDFLPEHCNLFIGNSMAIRDYDTFFHHQSQHFKVYANRGANGIDGVVSTALGISAIDSAPAYLVLGDLSFFHDLNGLLAAKIYHLNLFIIVINNDGGAIFSFLPQANEERQFEHLFGTPHGLDFSSITKMYDGHYRKASKWQDVEQAFCDLASETGLRILEVKSNRLENVIDHRKLMEAVKHELLEKRVNHD